LTVTDPLGDSYTIDENQLSVPLGSYGQLVHRWTLTRGVSTFSAAIMRSIPRQATRISN